jgi:hypothetical protein
MPSILVRRWSHESATPNMRLTYQASILAAICVLAGLGGPSKSRDPIPQEKRAQAVEDSKMNGLPDGIRILQESQKPEELERAAESLAASSSENDLRNLENFLRDQNFLRRLDPPKGHGIEVDRFRNVLLVLGRNPLPYGSKVLQVIGGEGPIRSQSDRVDVLLEAAAGLKPLPPERLPLFRAFDRGYFLLKLKLFVDNGSSVALGELEQEILAKPDDVEDDSVVSLMHRSFVPHRTDEPLIRMAEDLAQRNISSALTTGLFESFFDYQSRQWYGPVRVPPEPADLNRASGPALRELLRLGDIAKNAAISAGLKRKVLETLMVIHEVLAQRGGRG